MRYILFILISLSSLSYAQNTKQQPDYLNPALSIKQRVDDLLSRMTLEEKISQMVNNAQAIPRLQISPYNWWNECLHGVARAGTATVFPQAIGLAATWNTDLIHQIADVISTEARAKYNDYIRKDDRTIFKGLTFWSPNINIFRDPRWGRGQETYGEDPYLTSRMGVAFVKGLQGDDPKYFKVIATPKHYAVHSGPEPDRHMFNAIIDNHDLYDTYLPAFEACVKEGGAFSVMCAYNRLLGEACCGSPLLLRNILRLDWGFKGYVVSDCSAINDIYENHKVVKTGPEASALAVRSGTDLECGQVYNSNLMDAVRLGLITEKEITESVKRLFEARFRLGMFDPPEIVPYTRIPIEENDSKEHRQLARRAAQESIVLLKNADNILPLKKNQKKIAVIGPTADSYVMLLGNYFGTPSTYVTPLQGILDRVTGTTEVSYEPGCNIVEEGDIRHDLTSDILSTSGKPGLQIEYFKNNNPQGVPFFSRVDILQAPNWIWGSRIPSFDGSLDISSVRWSGTLTAPATGEFNFIIKSDGGFRFFLNDSIVNENWTGHTFDSQSIHLHLEKGKPYAFKLEYCITSRRPQLFVQWTLFNDDHMKRALEIVKKSDLVIFVGGITSQLEGEQMPVDLDGFYGGDRTNLNLPKVQEDLLKLIHKTGKPIILVLTSGSALAVNWANEHLPAIVQLWYPGEEGGTALADVLFGDYNPGGRLPVTFYSSANQLPEFKDYTMKGRTYRYFNGQPLFSFGYGLSYTKFHYSDLKIPNEIQTMDTIKLSVAVQNIGKIAGDEVIQLYTKNLTATGLTPLHSLQRFKRIYLTPGEKRVIDFVLLPKQLSSVKSQAETGSVTFSVEPGVFEITVGGTLPGTNTQTTDFVQKKLKIIGVPKTIQ